MNTELKRLVDRVKDAQGKLQKIMKDQDWIEEARKYAEKQSTEVKKLFSSDIGKVKTFIERERKELERFQKQIPGEVKRFKTLLTKQRAEFEKILSNLSKTSAKGTKSAGRARKKASTGTRKKTSSKST